MWWLTITVQSFAKMNARLTLLPCDKDRIWVLTDMIVVCQGRGVFVDRGEATCAKEEKECVWTGEATCGAQSL